MPNKNDSNYPTNASEVKKQNQQSAQKANTPQANNYRTEFASETNVTEVKKQNQQSAQKASAPQGSNSRTEFASETDANEVYKQNQQSAQKKNNASSPQANRSSK